MTFTRVFPRRVGMNRTLAARRPRIGGVPRTRGDELIDRGYQRYRTYQSCPRYDCPLTVRIQSRGVLMRRKHRAVGWAVVFPVLFLVSCQGGGVPPGTQTASPPRFRPEQWDLLA